MPGAADVPLMTHVALIGAPENIDDAVGLGDHRGGSEELHVPPRAPDAVDRLHTAYVARRQMRKRHRIAIAVVHDRRLVPRAEPNRVAGRSAFGCLVVAPRRRIRALLLMLEADGVSKLV